MEEQVRKLTDKGARRWGHLSSKATHSLLDLSNQRTISLPRSWNGVGKAGSKSSIRETGYQLSLHENGEDELSLPDSSTSTSSKFSASDFSESAVDGGVGGAATRTGRIADALMCDFLDRKLGFRSETIKDGTILRDSTWFNEDVIRVAETAADVAIERAIKEKQSTQRIKFVTNLDQIRTGCVHVWRWNFQDSHLETKRSFFGSKRNRRERIGGVSNRVLAMDESCPQI